MWTSINQAPGGVTKMTVRDRSDQSPGLVKVTLKGAGGLYAVSDRYQPIKAIVVLGAQAAADAGQCGESAFIETDCDTTERQMTCR